MDQSRLDRCRTKLRETAIAGARFTYGKLAAHIGVDNRSVGPFLNAIYSQEMASGRPDITLLAVYAGTNYGRYNSRGERPQSIRVNPNDREQCRRYDADVKCVHEYWHGQSPSDFSISD